MGVLSEVPAVNELVATVVANAAASPVDRIREAMKAARVWSICEDGESGKIHMAAWSNGGEHGVIHTGESGWMLDPKCSTLSPAGAFLIAEDPPCDRDDYAAPDPELVAADALGVSRWWVTGLCDGVVAKPIHYAALVGMAAEEPYLSGLADGFALRIELRP